MGLRHDTTQDKNFDSLAHRFRDKVYGQLKGDIRLAVIERDLKPFLGQPLSILDAGGGQGQLAVQLAKQGHALTLCDISAEMLALAKQNAAEHGVDTLNFRHLPLQALPENFAVSADLVLCHAVLEWLAKPAEALPALHACLKPGGLLSLAFFNVNSLIFKNLLRGNYRKVVDEDFVGWQGSLTPIHPLRIDDVLQWCATCGFEVLNHSGIRVFHDYILDADAHAHDPETALAMELRFSQEEPFRSLGRYIHVMARKL